MIDTIYIEEDVRYHLRTQIICQRFPRARKIYCHRYGEVFNPKAQNFRLQKKKPALILAEKHKNFILEAPPGYGIGASKNYYFSHMLNCLYDCRYCFLQGMLQSANYLLFVNYDSFQDQIREISLATPEQPVHFFSGYDCDSLAMEPITGFAEAFIPLFDQASNAWLELRTKSTQVRSLLSRPAIERCVVAFSFTPAPIAQTVENKAPSVQRRIAAIHKLQERGWQIGLRFDPLIYQANYKQQYQELFTQIFAHLDIKLLHSVSVGVFRLPVKFFKKIQQLYPDEKLFAGPLATRQRMVSYQQELEQDMLQTVSAMVLDYIPKHKFFTCTT